MTDCWNSLQLHPPRTIAPLVNCPRCCLDGSYSAPSDITTACQNSGWHTGAPVVLGSLFVGHIRTLINPFASGLAEVPDPLRQDVTAGTHLVVNRGLAGCLRLQHPEVLRPASCLRSADAGQSHDSVECDARSSKTASSRGSNRHFHRLAHDT